MQNRMLHKIRSRDNWLIVILKPDLFGYGKRVQFFSDVINLL